MATAAPSITHIKTADLSFDPRNPRFYRLNDFATDAQVVEEMLDDEAVQDLMASIGQKGYFEGEPLLVTKEDGKLIVVEGNRRLAAVKLLNRQLNPPARRKTSVEILRKEAVEEPPLALPCIEYKTRKESMRYLGYRHITGIKEWDSLSKAQYLSDIKDEFYANLDRPTLLKSLSNDIGSRPDYVGQLLTALELYHKAHKEKFFGLPMEARDVEFSYITTALNYKNITEWLGLDHKGDFEMPKLKADRLRSIFSWFFTKDQTGRTIIGESRNLKELSEIVKSKSATQALEEHRDLSVAYLYSEGPQQALVKALEEAINKCSLVWSMLPRTEAKQAQLKLASELAEISRDIRNTLRNKLED